MRLRNLAAILAAGLMAVGTAASATTVTPNDKYHASSVKTGGNFHTFWFVGLLGGSRYWQFTDGGTMIVDDNSAQLKGTIQQNGNAGNKLDVDISFAYKQTGTGNGVVGKCGGGCPAANVNTWDYFSYDTVSMTGTAGSLLDGMSIDLTMKPANGKMPPQMGDYANDKNAGLGFSSWYYWTSNFNGATKTGYGDINVNLVAAPLPAGMLLLLSGLGGLAFLRRRATA